MTQTSPERVQAGPEIGEQDRPEIADGQDVPRVYVVAGEQDGDLLGGPAVECRPGGVVSIPAALLGAGEVVSATAMSAAHLGGPGAAVAAVAVLSVGAWGVRAHRVAAAVPAAGRGRATSGLGGRDTRRGVRPGTAARRGRVAGVKAGAARAAWAAGAPVRAARRGELAAARMVGGHTRAAAGRAKATGVGRAATTTAGRARAGAGQVVDAGRRAGRATGPARRRMGEAAARRRENARTAATRRRAIRTAVRGQDGPGRKAAAARRAAREFDKRLAARSGRQVGRARRAGRWIGSHAKALGSGAWVLASRLGLAGLAGLGGAVLRRLAITWRPKGRDQDDEAEIDPTEDREAPEARGDTGHPEEETTLRKRSTTMGSSMTGSEFGILLEDLAGQMAAAAAAYDPETMPEWGGDIAHLSAALTHVATAISVLHAKTNDLPIEPAVSDTLVSAISLVGSAASTAEETASTFRALHAPDLERHEAPRPAEQKWNV